MYTTSIFSLESLPLRGGSIAEEASLLKIAFLCSNANSLLSEYIKKKSPLTDSERQLLLDLIELLDRMIEALHFMYEGQMNLIPNSEALETVFKLTEGELRMPYDKVSENVIASKKLLGELLVQDKTLIGSKSIRSTKVFLRKIQTIVLQKLDNSLEPRTNMHI